MATKWTQDEEAVFKALHVPEQNVSMRELIRGQRQINGRLFAALNLILDSLPEPDPAQCTLAGVGKITEARKIVEGIPGPPPGCEPLKGGDPQT